MPKVNILSTKVTLAADVQAGAILGWDGNLATTGTNEPAGVAQYEGKAGEIIAVTVIGLEDVKATGLARGDALKVANGEVAKASAGEAVFATVSAVNSTQQIEILIK